MSFEEFIVKYYGWVLAVLAILIITVIGFIADKKSKKKKEGKKMNENLNNQLANSPDVMPLNMEPTPVQTPEFNQNMNSTMPSPSMGEEVKSNTEAPYVAPPVMNDVQMPTMANPVSEEVYKPLSEQTPNIPPRFEGMPVNNNQPVESPVMPEVNMEMPYVQTPVMNDMSIPNFGPAMATPEVTMPSQPEVAPVNDFVMPVQPENIMPEVGTMNNFSNVAPVENVMPQPAMPTPPVNMDMGQPNQINMNIGAMPQYTQPIVEQPVINPIQPEPIQMINPEPIPLTQPVQPQTMPNQNVNMANPSVSPLQQPMPNNMYNTGSDVNNMNGFGNPNNMPSNMNSFGNNNNPW